MRRSFFWSLLVIVVMAYVIIFGVILVFIGVKQANFILPFVGILVSLLGLLGIVLRQSIVDRCEKVVRQYIANVQQWDEARKRHSLRWAMWDGIEVAFIVVAGAVTIAAMFLGRLYLALLLFVLWFPGLTVLTGLRAVITQLAWKGHFAGPTQIVKGAEARRQGIIRIIGGMIGMILCVVAAMALVYVFAKP